MFEEEKQEREKVSGAPEIAATMEPAATEAEDILYPLDGQIQPGELKSALAGQKLKPVSPSRAPMAPENVGPEVEISPPLLSKKGLFLIIGVVLVAVVAVGVGYSLWRSSQKNAAALPPSPASTANEQPALPTGETTTQPGTAAPATEQPTAPTAEQSVNQPIINTDTDGDGLSDQEEKSLGTDPTKQDTDGDGLTDYEEVVLWKTNPLLPDTDGDTFSDGTEVKNGFNPLGSGKLLQLPK